MQYLLAQRGLKTAIVYDREMEKSDSVAMLELFGIGMALARRSATLGAEDWALLVDGQKGGGNLTDLPTDEVACIDHHEYRPGQGYRFEDIRPSVGACSSIVAEYFFENSDRAAAQARHRPRLRDHEGHRRPDSGCLRARRRDVLPPLSLTPTRTSSRR